MTEGRKTPQELAEGQKGRLLQYRQMLEQKISRKEKQDGYKSICGKCGTKH